MMNRAYSVLEIKAVDEDARVIEGIATTASADRLQDIVEPKGAEFNLPIPLLWHHDSRQPIGHVTEAKITSTGIVIKAKIEKIDEPGILKDRLDEAWQSLKLKLVRGLSIGFKPIEFAQIGDTFGTRFTKWLWLELSAVTLPANADASITRIRSIDTALLAASGHGQSEADRRDPPGVSGSTKLLKTKVKTMPKPIAEQISEWEAKRASQEALKDAIMDAANERGETLDAEETERYDGFDTEVKSIDAHLARLVSAEKYKAAMAKPVSEIKSVEDGGQARAGVVVRAPQKSPPGIDFTRFAKCKAIGRLDNESPREIARELYGENSPVYGLLVKTAVGAASSGVVGWAGNLISDEGGAFADFIEFLRPQTILGKFGSDGVPSLRRVPFRRALLGQTSGGSAYWTGEGKPKPLTKFDFTRTTLEPLKVANIAVVTEEVLRDSSPSAEMLVRDGLAKAIVERLDIDFIDPDKAVSAGVSPASISNGITALTSDGNDADAVREDIKAVVGSYTAVNNRPSSGVWIMSSATALSLSLMTNPLGQPEFTGISMLGGSFRGMPVIVSDYVAQFADSNGEFVFLVNADDIYLADEGGIRVDMSNQASLQMDDAPGTQNAITGAGTSLVSLWQTNTVGFLAERTINWARRRSEAVTVLGSVNWGAAGS